jgi:tRNA A64-2'-O-ribosylphosphate transferase
VEILLDVNKTEDDTDRAIDALVERERQQNESYEANDPSLQSLFDFIGETNIAIGTRRAGRPPECWRHFDVILNVTDMEYPNIHETCCNEDNRFYLQLPVKEGKRDKSELERWMAVGIVYCVIHAQQKRRILIHCAQGKDRSVAVAMAITVLFCDLTFPLQWKDDVWKLNVLDFESIETDDSLKDDRLYKSSGLPECLIDGLQGREGRDCFLQWVLRELDFPDDAPLATKESLRIALHLLRQDREKAEPTRSTMQKLNRFFMSGCYDK